MSYAAIEAKWQTLLQALATFEDADVTRGDYLVLDKGAGPYVVLYQGRFGVDRPGDYSQVHYGWMTYMEVFAQFQGVGGASEAALQTAVQAVVDLVGANPTVGGLAGVTLAGVTAGDDVEEVYVRGVREAPGFLMQRLSVVTEEDVLYVGSGEFA